MDQPRKYVLGVESKIFDPRDASTGSSGAELLDATASKRGERWWMYLAGQVGGFGATDIYSASLPSKAQLAATGWKLTRSATGELAPVAERRLSFAWDGKGGRHCRHTSRVGTPAQANGWSAFTMQVGLRTYGGRTRSAICNGTERGGQISQNPRSLQMRRGNTEAYTNRTLSIMTANLKCGTSPDRTMRIISCRDTQKAKTAELAGVSMRSLHHPK